MCLLVHAPARCVVAIRPGTAPFVAAICRLSQRRWFGAGVLIIGRVALCYVYSIVFN